MSRLKQLEKNLLHIYERGKKKMKGRACLVYDIIKERKSISMLELYNVTQDRDSNFANVNCDIVETHLYRCEILDEKIIKKPNTLLVCFRKPFTHIQIKKCFTDASLKRTIKFMAAEPYFRDDINISGFFETGLN